MAEQPTGLATPQEVERASQRPPVRWKALGQILPISLFLAFAFLGSTIYSSSPLEQDLSGRLQPPAFSGGSWDHPLGTDGLGRDLFARIADGARLSLIVSAIAAAGAGAIGVVAGVVSGMFGGWIDSVITMLVETILAVPFITVGIVVTATVGQSLTNLLVLLMLSGWITHARIVRMQVQSLIRADFILAATAMGARRSHVAWRHVLPNLAPVIIVVLFQQAGSMLLWSASLTYLGIGMPVDHISLGGIVREGQDLIYNAWWVSVFGGGAIAWAVAGFNLLADWIQRRIDPTLR